MTPERYDIAILGGGPAGTAAALSLNTQAPQLAVAIIESSAYDQLRIGETLPPTVQPLLVRLGVWSSFLTDGHLPAYGSCAAWGSDRLESNEFIYGKYGRGWHLDRMRFDTMLASAAVTRGSRLFTNTHVVDAHQKDSGWRLTLRQGGAHSIIDATFAIDATGRRAAFAARLGVKKKRVDHLLGAFVFLRGLETEDSYSMVEAAADGWWYSALLPGAGMVAAWMSDADLMKQQQMKTPARWFARLQQSAHTRRRVSSAEPLTQPVLQAACSQRLAQVTGDHWLAVGDAAATFDPLSSLGIFKALRTGMLASYAVRDFLTGDRSGLDKYRLILEREFAKYLTTRAEFYGQERRWASAPFWRRRHEEARPEMAQ
jgi:flavin-dependent dehydrogenase